MRSMQGWMVCLALALVGAGGCELVSGLNGDATHGNPGTGGASTSRATGSGGGPVCKAGLKMPCYTGPKGTENVGTRHGGTQTCAADGMAFGPCMGEQTPAAETCGSGKDTNCDGFLCGQTKWATAFGTPLVDSSGGVGVDAAGNVYAAGGFGGETAGAVMHIGQFTLITAGGSDVFVAKFDPKGTALWAKRFGDVGNDFVSAMAVGASGNIVLAGFTDGMVDFGGGAIMGEIVVAMLDSDGNYVWSTSCGGTTVSGADSTPSSIAFDPNGDIVVAGSFNGTVDCGGGMHVSVGNTDILLAKLSGAKGTEVWSNSFGDANIQTAGALAVDATGNIVLSGSNYGTVSFGGSDVMGSGAYAARFSSSGGSSWSLPLGTSLEIRTGGTAVDSSATPSSWAATWRRGSSWATMRFQGTTACS